MTNRQAMCLCLITIVLLVGCKSPQPAPEDTQDDFLSELPVTLTTEETYTPQPTKTIPGKTPSPSPDFIPPTPSPFIRLYPTQTPFTYQELPALISGKEITISFISMSTSEKGWATGTQDGEYQYILYTSDGGYNWQDRTPPILVPINIHHRKDNIIAYFYDQNTAWVLIADTKDDLGDANYIVWRTQDGGLTWIPSDPLPFPLGQMYISPGSFSFINPTSGWLLIQTEFSHQHDLSYLFSTRDGGATWRLINRPGNSMIEVRLNTGMAFANDQNGWVTKDELGGGLGPFMEQTHDGGITWENIFLPPSNGKTWEDQPQSCQTISPTFTSSQTGLVLVQCFIYDENKQAFDMENPDTFIYATSDWGESWQIIVLPSPANQLFFLDFLTGFAQGKDHYKTINGGADWDKIKTVTWEGQFIFINSTEGWAVARRGEDIALLHTGDGGRTYQQIIPLALQKTD